MTHNTFGKEHKTHEHEKHIQNLIYRQNVTLKNIKSHFTLCCASRRESQCPPGALGSAPRFLHTFPGGALKMGNNTISTKISHTIIKAIFTMGNGKMYRQHITQKKS